MDGEHPEQREEQKKAAPCGGTSPGNPDHPRVRRGKVPPRPTPTPPSPDQPSLTPARVPPGRFHPRSPAQLPRLAFIDVETTGANPVVDRVTEIAILRVENGELVERWSSLVNPGMGIPPSIQGFTGITDAMVAGRRLSPSWLTACGAAAGRLRLRRPQRALRLRFHQERVPPHRPGFRRAGAGNRQAVAGAVSPVPPPRPRRADRAPQLTCTGLPPGDGRHRGAAPVCRHRRRAVQRDDARAPPSSRP